MDFESAVTTVMHKIRKNAIEKSKCNFTKKNKIKKITELHLEKKLYKLEQIEGKEVYITIQVQTID